MNGSFVTTILLVSTGILAILAFAIKAFPSWPAAVVGGVTVAWVVISFPLAALSVAHNERLARIQAETDLADERKRQLPGLVGNIRILGKLSDKRFFICMEVRNEGHPSVARDFMPMVTIEGREIYGRLLETENAIRFKSPDGSVRMLLEKDAIYYHTQTPIMPGDIRSGHLLVEFPADSPTFPKEIIRIRFRDYIDQRYETEPNEDCVATDSLPDRRMLPFERNPD